jgi:hypothetical protein
MPARSNIFQRLVREIQRDLSPNLKVTESRFLRDAITGRRREVDVTAEGYIDGRTRTLSIEVRDRRRPADVPWVEGMIQKHEDLPTDALELWSTSGFAKDAIVKAQAYGARTVTPGSVAAAGWATMARDIADGWIKRVHASNVAAHIDLILPDGTAACWQPKPDVVLKELAGDRCQTIGVLLEIFLNSTDVRTLMLDRAPSGLANNRVRCNLPFTCVVQGLEEIVGPLNHLIVTVDTQTETARATTKSALHEDVATTLAEANYARNALQVVVKERLGGAPVVNATQIDGHLR